MQQVISDLKLINLNTNDDNSSLNSSIDYSLQINFDKLIEEYDKDLSDNEIIINELLLLYENAIQKEIYKEDYIQSIKQHIVLKNKDENEIFNYLLENKDKQQNITLLAEFYQFGIGTE